MIQRLPSVVLVLACAGLLGACGLSRPAAEKQSYLLNVPNVAGAENARSGGAGSATRPRPDAPVLRVNRFVVAQPFDGKGLVYRASENGWSADFYHQFLAFPATMLTENATSWLAARGLFGAVVPMGSALDSSHVLEASVPAMFGDFRADPAAAVLSIRFLLARDDGTGDLLYDRLIERRVPLASRTPGALVAGLDAALAQILVELDADLRRLQLVRNTGRPAAGAAN